MKAVYFFPGEAGPITFRNFTTHPSLADDQHWNTDPSSRKRVIQRLAAAHVNTVVMSYWSNMPQWSPMDLAADTIPGVLQAVQGSGMVIIPTIEGGFEKAHPEIPHWEFATDFPSPSVGGPVAPGLIERIGELVGIFRDNMDLWAELYDRNGEPRYAVNVLHVYSELPGVTDDQFAQAFHDVAERVQSLYHIKIGFTLDLIGGDFPYVATPNRAGRLLEGTHAVLAINGFESEVFSGKVLNGTRCPSPMDWHNCQPHDNNIDNIQNLAIWKQAALHDWVGTGIPVILDVSNGYDGRIVFANADGGTGFWGDNMNYTDDRWRNWMSQLKGSGVKGITFDTWNGFTEGYAGVPSREHAETVYMWLTDLLEPDPRQCSHMHYAGGIPTFRVYGAICEKWVQLGGDRGFGAPITNELVSAHGRVSYFAGGGAVYWSSSTGAHEVHGLIAQTYWESGGDWGCLGLPISDEEPFGGGRISHFEHGQIDWKQGNTRGRVICIGS